MNDVAGNRKHPDFDAIPILVGDFTIHPTLQIQTNYDGNWINRSDSAGLAAGLVGALPALAYHFGQGLQPSLTQQVGLLNVNPHIADHADYEFDIDPGLSAKHEANGNVISFDVAGRFYRYAKLKREDRTEWHSDLVGVIALGEKDNITLIAGGDSHAEAAGANGAAVLDYFGFGPSIHTSAMTSANINLTFGRFTSKLNLSYSRDYYSHFDLRTADLLNATGLATAKLPALLSISQDYRADQNPQVQGNIAYNLTPDTQAFVQLTYQYLNELDPPHDRANIPEHSFDSDTYGFVVGAAQTMNRIIVYQVGIGWQLHKYRDPFYQDTSRLVLDGAVDWYPTELLSFRAMTSQTYISSAVYGVGDTAVRTLELRADYEFRPNIEVWALWASEWDHFPAGAGTSVAATKSAIAVQSANFEIDYRPNRLLQIALNCGYHNRISSDAIVLGRFTAFRAGLALTFRH